MDLTTIVMLLVPTVIGVVFGLAKRQGWLDDKLAEALEVGVRKAWDEFGKERKKQLVAEEADPNSPTESSKFTQDDKARLLGIAKATAGAVLKDQGLDLNKLVKSDLLQDLKIKQMVDKLKASK